MKYIKHIYFFFSTKKPFDVPLSVNTPNSSQYIKQELRNICNARLEKPVFQSQMATSQLMQQLQPQQQQLQQQTHQQQLDTEQESGSELPPDILDQSKFFTKASATTITSTVSSLLRCTYNSSTRSRSPAQSYCQISEIKVSSLHRLWHVNFVIVLKTFSIYPEVVVIK